MAHPRYCRLTNRLITDSRHSHISNILNNCTDCCQRYRVVRCQRYRVVRELLHSAKLVRSSVDNDALYVSFSTYWLNSYLSGRSNSVRLGSSSSSVI